MYFYNGAGVGAGDFNNDGMIDLFFSANQGENKLYLNKGNMKFEDVTLGAKIPQDGGWSTGVSIVDINNDGLPDIYVCRVGNYESLQSKNQFLICKGIDEKGVPYYADEGEQMGLDFSGFSTQAAFLDYDGDGDLDMFLMNHSLRFNGTFNERQSYLNTFDSLSGDYLYRNDNGTFTNVTQPAGIYGYIIGYGLGIAVADINLDGWPDIYIGNDFHENDYLYINQQNGTFKEVLQEVTTHTSQFSMGVDVADITNDAWPEIISMDMLPEDPYILKRSLGEDEYNLFHFKIKHGYHPQFARNTLQLNRGNGLFSEIGMYSGVHATDWSWASLFVDFNNDGWKDLFVSNGIPKRLNDIDYINYASNSEVQEKIRNNKLDEKDMALVEKFPEIKLKNKFYLNKQEAVFEDMEKEIKNNIPTFSNGSAFADFDNDGDLDLVVNNINEPAIIYKNMTNDGLEKKSFIELKLTGSNQNINATGAKAIVFAGNEIRTYEKFPVKGFQGSMEIPIHIGLHGTKVDSIVLIWPDNSAEKINYKPDIINHFSYHDGLPQFKYTVLLNRTENKGNPVSDITNVSGIQYLHEENPFNEFDREPLIPFMSSREGPALATGDLNSDGLDDVFIGSSKFKKPALFIQQANGSFIKSDQPALDADSTYEEVDACWVDVNNDKHLDLILASGGNEYYGNSEYLKSRVFLNDGKGKLQKLTGAFGDIMMTAS
ncbi:MAG TPA: VCBS repeat-containing protein, partial [Chitinophagaceae bacterium]|nr:VCBS repeat-containing protein [Chitinophagaceae bacterium]